MRSINKVLEEEIKENDIIVLQEATIPLLKSIDTIFDFFMILYLSLY